MSWAAIVSGRARQPNPPASTIATSNGPNHESNDSVPPPSSHTSSPSQLAASSPDPVQCNGVMNGNSPTPSSTSAPQSPTNSPATSSESSFPDSTSGNPFSSFSPPPNDPLPAPLTQTPKSDSRPPHSPRAVPTSNAARFRSYSHHNTQQNGQHSHSNHPHQHHHNCNHNHRNKHKSGKKHHNQSQPYNNTYTNVASHQNSDYHNHKLLDCLNHSHPKNKFHRHSSSPMASPKASKKQARSTWDEHTLSTYRLWANHISFFMAHPTNFFAVFVTNPIFRQSVFDAGLTFHPDTDPAHPVLINLNSEQFGMAERISALSPPAGLNILPSTKSVSVSLPPSVPASSIAPPTSVSSPTSPHAIQTIQPLSRPVYVASPIGHYQNASSSPLVNGDRLPVLIDGFTGLSIYTDKADSLTVSDHSPLADDSLPTRLSKRRVDGSDTDSERFSDGEFSHLSGVKFFGGMQEPFFYNGVHNAHRTEPVRDGRRKVVSRVLDIRIPPSPICQLQTDKAKVELNEQIESLFPSVTQPPEYALVRDDLLSRLRLIISREWKGAGIDVYGSAGNGLGLESADVDMSLYMPKALAPSHALENGKSEWAKMILSRLAIIMQQNGMTILSQFLDARVPVIKMLDPISKLQVDVCVNNNLAVLNTQLLKAYVNLDERFRYVCILVKYWAKQRDLNDTYNGTLSSYAYTLLVIHFLQTLNPPVLPCLQRMVNGKEVGDDEQIPCEMTDNGGANLYNTYFDRSVSRETYESDNTSSVHELLLGFFHYYAYIFDYRNDLASIRLGKRIPRAERAWDEPVVSDERELKVVSISQASGTASVGVSDTNREVGSAEKGGSKGKNVSDCEHDKVNSRIGEGGYKENHGVRERIDYARRPALVSKHLFCIEDPFDIDHDLSRGMEKAAVTVIRQEMMRAYEIIAETGDFVAACEEYG